MKGAATGCVVRSCMAKCHVPCGLKNGFLLQHHGQFDARCPIHRLHQNQDLVSAALNNTESCPICFKDDLHDDYRRDRLSILACPVCQTCFHRTCLQKQAWSVGSESFGCLMCTNRDEFTKQMLNMGLEIPEK